MAVLDNSTSPARLEAQPLYVKARNIMVDRLISGQWRPGEMLPSEFAIADELGVSQGTVRKALDDMTAQGLLVRRQGRGTFVAEAEDKSILFRFYRLTPNEGQNASADQAFPESRYLSKSQGVATEQEQEIFDIGPTDRVWRFERLRSDANGPILWEQLVLPARYFSDFTPDIHLPNNVYQFYSTHYGIIVAKVNEQLRAVTAPDNVADLLQLPKHSPLLEIDRRAIALDDRVVEWRRSLCRSDTMHYRNQLK
ncbi:MAG: GntR family transcriptional regulator [Rhizobiaceae bacterium]